MPTKKPTQKPTRKSSTKKPAPPLQAPSKVVQRLLDIYQEGGPSPHALLQALHPMLPLSDTLWAEIRRVIPFEAFTVTRDGNHIFLYNMEEPSDFIPNSHPLIHVMNTRRRSRSLINEELPEWVLCSFCGKPIRTTAIEGEALDTLTNCPNLTPHLRGSGWIVETIPIPTHLARFRPE